MTIQILLKIGAVGILVALLNQILKHSGQGGARLSAQSGGTIMCFPGYPVHKDLFNEIMDIVNI